MRKNPSNQSTQQLRIIDKQSISDPLKNSQTEMQIKHWRSRRRRKGAGRNLKQHPYSTKNSAWRRLLERGSLILKRKMVPLESFREKAYSLIYAPKSLLFLSYPTIIKQYPQFTSAAHKRDSYRIIGGKINISTDWQRKAPIRRTRGSTKFGHDSRKSVPKKLHLWAQFTNPDHETSPG